MQQGAITGGLHRGHFPFVVVIIISSSFILVHSMGTLDSLFTVHLK